MHIYNNRLSIFKK